MSKSSIWAIDKTLSGATTPGQSGPGSNVNEEVLCIPESSSITRASPSDCLVLYLEHSLGESYSFAEMQSVYSTADWASRTGASLSDIVLCHTKITLFCGGGSPLCKGYCQHILNPTDRVVKLFMTVTIFLSLLFWVWLTSPIDNRVNTCLQYWYTLVCFLFTYRLDCANEHFTVNTKVNFRPISYLEETSVSMSKGLQMFRLILSTIRWSHGSSAKMRSRTVAVNGEAKLLWK